MKKSYRLIPALVLGALLGLGAAQAQQISSSTVDFEILSVDGNRLVVRDQNGTHEYTVPADLRFRVDGRSLAVGDLRAGMKGSATVTTTTTVVPVYVTEVHSGEVLSRVARTVTVRGDDGVTRRYTQTELDESGVRIYRDGRVIRVSDLNPGDQLSATFVTKAAPEVLTAQQVEATLAAPDAPAAGAAATQAAAAPAAVADAGSTTPESPAATGSRYWWLAAVLLVGLIGLIVFLDRRRRQSR